MITPKPSDAKHKVQLIRLLTALVDDAYISRWVHFKGGTCAALLGYLDRFSVDLDFDIEKGANLKKMQNEISKCCTSLGLTIKSKSTNTLFYILKYDAPQGGKNTLKLSFMNEETESNKYEKKYIGEIDRFVSCQTIETMFANKLVALTNRYKKNKSIAVRDLYDIHHFFEMGYRYDPIIIELRTGKNAKKYLGEVMIFISKMIKERAISEDLSFLLEHAHFLRIRKTIKQETIGLIQDEITRLSK